MVYNVVTRNAVSAEIAFTWFVFAFYLVRLYVSVVAKASIEIPIDCLIQSVLLFLIIKRPKAGYTLSSVFYIGIVCGYVLLCLHSLPWELLKKTPLMTGNMVIYMSVSLIYGIYCVWQKKDQ